MTRTSEINSGQRARGQVSRVNGGARGARLAGSGRQTTHSVLDWVLRYAVPLVGAVGALLYGMLRLAYFSFYVQVRATPEEVGYGYTEILAGQLIGAAELVVIVAALAWTLCVVVTRSLRWMGSRFGVPTVVGRRPGPGIDLARLAVRCALGSVVAVLVMLPLFAWAEGAQAANGFTVRNVYLRAVGPLPVLAVEAVPAHVAWTSGAPEGAPDLDVRECLMYLGRNEGTAVFFDVRTRESIHVPTGGVVITLRDVEAVPAGC